MNEYKGVLKLWYKGTRRGSGEHSMFQDWTQDKLDRYDIDPKVYDHTIVNKRPAILMDGYAKRKKYLTVLFILDKKRTVF